MRVAALLALLRPALPLLLGLSLGCSLSLLRVSWIQGDGGDPCVDTMLGNNWQLTGGQPQGTGAEGEPGQMGEEEEDFRPRIVPYYRDPSKPHKKVLR